MPVPTIPATLNLGSGKDFRDECLNLDVLEDWAPDAVCDLAAADVAAGVTLATLRFGTITLRPGTFDSIVANDVLEHVPDLAAMMTNCLALLRPGGTFAISVPYDLSYGAWQDPTHVRAFNERSWLYYTDWFWYMGWSEHRFDLQSFDFVPSPLGVALREKGLDRDDILRTPRAVDSMSVTLRKVALSDDDRLVWKHWRDRKLAAQARFAPPRAGPRAFDGTFAALRDRYCIWIVTPPDYAHARAYDEAADGLSAAFRTLGGSAPVIRDLAEAQGRAPIVFGPHLLPLEILPALPADSVFFNLEQADRTSPWMRDDYLALLRQRPVLDYSVRNRDGLAALGIAHARLLPIGYADGLTRIAPAPARDIDILFYGSVNERRQGLLDALAARGARVRHLFGTYGAERDAAIARAKIVLNAHFYEASVFEAVRVTYLLANGACVVCEGEGDDPDIGDLRDGMAVEPYARLVERCLALLADDAERARLGAAGLAAMRRRPQARTLEALFAA